MAIPNPSNFAHVESNYNPSNIVSKSHRVGIRPLPDGLEVPAYVLRLKVGPVALDALVDQFWKVMEGEDANVALAHEIEPEGFDAVI